MRLLTLAAMLAATLVLALSPIAAAGTVDSCFDSAGSFYGIEPRLLRAIAQVESSYNQAATHANPDGTEDIGIMQINSWWLTALAPFRIDRRTLVVDPCTNINVGAWILKQAIQDKGYNWRAVGAYNAKSPEKAAAYAQAVWQVYTGATARTWSVRPAVPVADVGNPVQPRLSEGEGEGN